jgi:hypothetical protein
MEKMNWAGSIEILVHSEKRKNEADGTLFYMDAARLMSQDATESQLKN